MSRVQVVRVFAEDAPRQTAWAVMEEDEAVDYRNTRREAEGVAWLIRQLQRQQDVEKFAA